MKKVKEYISAAVVLIAIGICLGGGFTLGMIAFMALYLR